MASRIIKSIMAQITFFSCPGATTPRSVKSASAARVLSTRRITDLKSFSCFPERLREDHKNFDVYPQNTERSQSSRQRKRIKLFAIFSTLRICVARAILFCHKSPDIQWATMWTRFRTLRGGSRETPGSRWGGYNRNTRNSEGPSWTVSLWEFITKGTWRSWEHRARARHSVAMRRL